MTKTIETKIKNTLKRHEENIDNKLGASLINDFLQLSQILDALKEIDNKAYTAFYCLIQRNMELQEINAERGKRIAKLQKGAKNEA